MRIYDHQTMFRLQQKEAEKKADSAWMYFTNSQNQYLDDATHGKKSLRKVLENLLGLSN